MKNFRRTILRSESGTTMVEVLVAFVVLILILGMFSQAMSLAGRMMGRAENMLTDSREMAGGYYLEDGAVVESSVSDETTMVLTKTSGKSESFSIKVRLRSWTEKNGNGRLVEVLPETSAAGGE